MKKEYYIFGLLIILLLASGLFVYYFELLPFNRADPPPVEPEPLTYHSREDNYMKLKYYSSPDVQVFDISMDSRGNFILFGSNTKKVTLIDSEGKLKWEKDFEDNPLQTKIASCGNYIGIGTAGGSLLLMKNDQEIIREKKLENPINHLLISSDGRWLISGSGIEEEANIITFFDQVAGEEWYKETGRLLNMKLSPDDNVIFFTEKKDGLYNTVALDLQGNEKWTINQSELKAVSASGELLAVQELGDELVVYDNKGEERWRKELSSESARAFFNTQSNRLLVYDKLINNHKDNLFYFNPAGELLWQKRVEDDVLITFSADGEQIIYSSENHYRDAFSKVVVMDEKGDIKREFEVTVKVEKIIAAAHADEVFLAGNDGSVYQLDLDAPVAAMVNDD